MATKLDHLSEDTRDHLASLTERLANDPKTRKQFLGLVKQAAPSTPIPEIDTESAIEERLKVDREERKQFEQRIENRFLQEDLGRTKADAQRKYGLSDDDLSKMEEMMKKGELPADYRFAPQLYAAQLSAATPTNFGSGPYEGPMDIEANAKTMEGLMDDPDAWSRRQAHNLIEEARKRGGTRAF